MLAARSGLPPELHASPSKLDELNRWRIFSSEQTIFPPEMQLRFAGSRFCG